MSRLLLVPTPIGNLEDITIRAVKALSEADLILAEDTRHTAILLKKYNLHRPLQPCHKFNEWRTAKALAERIRRGEKMTLVSNAGTPVISDPGYLLVSACIEAGTPVECLPGPTALVPALAVSGLPSERFCFEGFLPHRKGKVKRLKELAEETRTMIFYESPHRLLKTIAAMTAAWGPHRKAAVVRELSKMHEEVFRGTLKEIEEHFAGKKVRGEVVVVIGGKKKEHNGPKKTER